MSSASRTRRLGRLKAMSGIAQTPRIVFSTNRTIDGPVQITKARGGLTELEGAILGVLRRGGAMSAYAMRQVFLVSQSDEWSGSAGAVYPAIARRRGAGRGAAGARGGGRGAGAGAP